ncbi:MAG: hypothetical protein EA417_21625 [Gammaproteobacteria bacterium]|nr:MAG: hypothetical protein EA417_21625 [Gammaproteobacteria bacterium]
MRHRDKVPDWVARFTASLSVIGVLTGTLFFAASLTPSLLPRTYVMQALLSGVSLSAGYGIGVFASWLWAYVGLPSPPARIQRYILYAASALCVAVAFTFLWQASGWQNSVRELMELPPVDTAHLVRVGVIAFIVFVVLLALARLFHLLFRFSARRFDRFIPAHVANVAGALVAIAVFWSVLDGVLFRYLLRMSDTAYAQVDAWIEPEQALPSDPMQTGSSASFIHWEGLGRRGRDFVVGGPTLEDLEAFHDAAVMKPIRVYVGLNSAETIEERAELALAELLRVDAFERSVLILATPTGTGWLDPSAMNPVEYLHRGDIASVAVQYSYLPSWMSLLAEPDLGAQTARAVFREVYGHWTSLPRDRRPALYLHGLSLGAMNSDLAADLYDIIADPFQGALWSGPPFRSSSWRAITDMRQSESTAWLPRFRDGSIVRFKNQSPPELPGAEWGPIRIVFLQYASDPITFFETESFYRQPDWMQYPRGPDVSAELRWYPVVTMLQLAVDMGAADTAPMGYGHVYAPSHYIDAWLEVTDPPDWTDAMTERLKALFAR